MRENGNLRLQVRLPIAVTKESRLLAAQSLLRVLGRTETLPNADRPLQKETLQQSETSQLNRHKWTDKTLLNPRLRVWVGRELWTEGTGSDPFNRWKGSTLNFQIKSRYSSTPGLDQHWATFIAEESRNRQRGGYPPHQTDTRQRTPGLGHH